MNTRYNCLRATRNAPRQTRQATRGLSLVELMCVLAISAVLMGNALPMFEDFRARHALEASAALLETDLQLARSEAQTHSRTVRLQVQPVPGGTTCYVIHNGPANACRCQGAGQARCEPGVKLLRLVEQDTRAGIALAALQTPLMFDAGKGTVTPTATLKLVDRKGRAVHQIINIVGRVRSCSPTAGMPGLKPCAAP